MGSFNIYVLTNLLDNALKFIDPNGTISVTVRIQQNEKNMEAKLSEKEQEIKLLRQRDAMNTDAITTLPDRLEQVFKEVFLIIFLCIVHLDCLFDNYCL